MAITSDISKVGEKVTDEVTRLFDEASDKVVDLASDAKKAAKHAVKDITSDMKKHPYQSFLWGMGLGAALGITATALLRRR